MSDAKIVSITKSGRWPSKDAHFALLAKRVAIVHHALLTPTTVRLLNMQIRILTNNRGLSSLGAFVSGVWGYLVSGLCFTDLH
jgi:hypothetical protein